ncbi:hypothetical protein K432DRAFT_410965 [Lepidopterella palustris CBS 459.81]|uniref:Uncharacterized protein n=1 Tax=Lepidopterella palustris CBS 459.81 TaxID=1314670 RepID=A0A8E2J8V9_9PEZI|nr:hypothetical protein K432DRAFT_410965 [Lepidopterella palustris CBS 459.81]
MPFPSSFRTIGVMLGMQLINTIPSLAEEASSSQQANSTRIHWDPPKTRRSTWDIIWTCATVFLICTWMCVHLNLPSIAETEAEWLKIEFPYFGGKQPVPYWPSWLLWKKWLRRIGLMAEADRVEVKTRKEAEAVVLLSEQEEGSANSSGLKYIGWTYLSLETFGKNVLFLILLSSTVKYTLKSH